jgi:hypothetical protein
MTLAFEMRRLETAGVGAGLGLQASAIVTTTRASEERRGIGVNWGQIRISSFHRTQGARKRVSGASKCDVVAKIG